MQNAPCAHIFKSKKKKLRFIYFQFTELKVFERATHAPFLFFFGFRFLFLYYSDKVYVENLVVHEK